MPRFIIVAAIAAVALLSGCTTVTPKPSVPVELSSANVHPIIVVDAPADTLVGDSVKVTATATLDDKRTDEVKVRIEVSDDGKTWTSIAETARKGPTVELTADHKTKNAGTIRYRAIVTTSAKDPQTIASKSAKVKTADIKAMIRKFYYDRTQAYQRSSARGAAWDIKHDSPIFNRKSASWKAGWKEEVANKSISTSVPSLSTVSPDPKWKNPRSSCSKTANKLPEGRTFVVTVTFGGTYNGYAQPAEPADVHVTYHGGRLVHYVQGCQD